MSTYLFPISGEQIIIEDEGNNFCVKIALNFNPEITIKDSKIEIKVDTKAWPRFEKESFLKQLENFIKTQRTYGK